MVPIQSKPIVTKSQMGRALQRCSVNAARLVLKPRQNLEEEELMKKLSTTKRVVVVRFRVMRDPESGGMLYLVGGGVGFSSMTRMKAAYPGAQFVRVPATRRNRIYG